jgi:hypothetical protein
MVRWVPKNPKNNSQDARDTIELLESKLKNHESLPGEGSGAERDAEMRALQYELATKERRIASLQVCLSVFCLSVCPTIPPGLPPLSHLCSASATNSACASVRLLALHPARETAGRLGIRNQEVCK